jgi:mycothiol synthase
MKVLPLEIHRKADFINYCKKYRNEQDNSYLYDDDLKEFTPDENNPTYILIDQDNSIVGAVSLLWNQEYRKSLRSRFRIYHSTIKTIEAYGCLLHAVMNKFKKTREVFLFINEDKILERNILEKLGFSTQRYAWLLRRFDQHTVLPIFPEGYAVKPFSKGNDEEAWCNISNKAFSIFNWHTDITPDSVKVDETSDFYIKDGMLMLWNGDTPVGIVTVGKDPYEGVAEIGPIAIMPEYQGKGLGRNLLRAALKISETAGFTTAVLSVNGENKRAADLYLSEGFQKESLMICYSKNLENISSIYLK